jgi:hypothetical protein
MHWNSMELLESNNLLAGWSGFELRSTPLQSKKITGVYSEALEPLAIRQSHYSFYLLVFRLTPLLLALVGSSDLVHLGACGELLKNLIVNVALKSLYIHEVGVRR